MQIIGHRGAKGLAKENTLKAITKALDYTVDAIEIDVRVNQYNVPVLTHNKSQSTDLTTLDETLKFLKGKVPLVIEIKKNEPIEPIVDIINKHLKSGYNISKLLIASKSQKTLRQIQNSLPKVKLIVIEPWSGVRAHYRLRQLNTDMLFMNQRWLWSFFIKSVARSNLKLYAYTVNDPVKTKKWEMYGLYGVITDFPDRFKELK